MQNKFYTRVKAPALPFAPVHYDRQYQDQTNTALRLYFTQVDFFISQFSQLFEVANLPSAVVVGAGGRAFVRDSSVTAFRSIVTGGGSTNIPVYSDGTNWRVG